VEETVGCELPIREERAPALRAVDWGGLGGATVLVEGKVGVRVVSEQVFGALFVKEAGGRHI